MSDTEEPAPFVEQTYEPLVYEEPKPERSAGRHFEWKEKNFKSKIPGINRPPPP